MDKRFKEPYSNPRWWWEGKYNPMCFDCVYFYGATKGLPRCEAYPDGIPRELMKRDVKHDQPYPCDNGFRFKQYQQRE